ncbi:MAG: NPCBM/NEW2 domain-containing protein [Muribaculaceae bacterium]|nr:NPCBM/NEW2 domain-containing protein [Muribaculaceae bacterium]
MKKLLLTAALSLAGMTLSAQDGRGPLFHSWAVTPPMGWNSWDCYGPTVVESEVKANADYMAENLASHGWEYVVVDIRWFVENDKAGGYNQTNPKYVYDEWGRYTPAVNRFPSAADGKGFKPLADYVHSKGLKFGIHIMRGLPKEAANRKFPVKGTDGITLDMIASTDSACTWLRDNYKVDYRKPGAQEYYNSIFDLYAEWGVDFIKVDDLSRPYHTAEVEMIRKGIDQTGRPMVLSISPGETPIDRVDHVAAHANMWRTVDDFWDNWSQLNYQFGICAKWAPHIAPGTWPDADMLPLGRISIRGERGAERWSGFTPDEQLTMMNLWTIFKSPLMFGGDMPQNDEATNALLTNDDVLYMHHYSAGNRQARNLNNHITWTAVDPANGDRFVALFNTGGSEFLAPADALFRSGTISYLTTGHATDVHADIPEGTRQLYLIVTDGGDGFDSDHADWINPVLTLKDGSKVDLTTLTPLRKTVGWGSLHVNTNIEGGKLSVDGVKYDKGLAVHANSVVVFDLPEGTTAFDAIGGIDNTGSDQGSKCSVEFFVFAYDPTYRDEWTDQWTAGNKEIKIDPTHQAACSGYISRLSDYDYVDLEAPVAGAERLFLVVTNGGDGFAYDHADWVNPVLVKADGTEVSLTTLKWASDVVNGYNQLPRLNRNNDGNTLNIGGTTYEYGIGCNSPAVIPFDLPAGHDYVTFRTRVGLDYDTRNAPEGATVEFRVFTTDPTPDNSADVTLDLALAGLAAGQQAVVKDMWTGENVGTYSDSELKPYLREHASALYRVTPLGRKEGATVSLTASSESGDYASPFTLTATVASDAPAEGAYIQLLQDGNVIATLPLGENNTATYLHAGLDTVTGHIFTARYSGTPAVAPAVSSELSLSAAGVDSVTAAPEGLEIEADDGALTVTADKACKLLVYTTAGRLAVSADLVEGLNRIPLAPGIYLAAGALYYVR